MATYTGVQFFRGHGVHHLPGGVMQGDTGNSYSLQASIDCSYLSVIW